MNCNGRFGKGSAARFAMADMANKQMLTAPVYTSPMRGSVLLIVTGLACAVTLGAATGPVSAQCLLCDKPQAAPGEDPSKFINLPLRVTINTRLDFSRAAIANIGQGSIVVTPDGARTVSGSLEDLGGMGVAGTVEIWGSPLRRISVEMPTTVELRAADGSVATVTNFRTDLKKNPNLGLFGYLKFNFGGELRVTAGQAGQFRGRIPITVEYD